jgi:signal transduction histidine kinase
MLRNLNDEQKINLAFIGSCIKGIVHNINTPLSAIMGRSEMLQLRLNRIRDKISLHNDREELDKCMRDISIIIENCNRVSETIKNVMQKSINAEYDKAQIINIANILKEELEFLKADMDFKHNIEKSYHIKENIPSIEGVYIHFSNSFLEILENSKQAMLNTEEKKLTVSVLCDGKCIEVKFHDTGCGIEPEKREQLLQTLQNPYSASQDTDVTDKGIPRIARLLKLYNVQFDIQSKPGDTTFSIKFPL